MTATITGNVSDAIGASAVASATAAISGGYDNTTHWPSLNNRPVYSSANNSLTWIGPSAGGPSTSSDVSQTQALTNSGPITTTSNGQIIQNLKITGTAANSGIIVAHNNVTIRRCYINGYFGGGAATYANISINAGVTGTLIEDCEINGNVNTTGSGTFNVLGNPLTNCTIRRCNCHTSEQVVSRTQQNCTYTDNYCWDTQGSDADMIEIYTDTGNSFNILIQHNTFWQSATGSGVSGYDSAINMSNWTSPGSISNVTIHNNRFLGINAPHLIIADQSFGPGAISGLVITNNGIRHQSGDSTLYIWLPFDTAGTVGVTTNSGNFVLADNNDTTITGAPWAGTGVCAPNIAWYG